MRGKYNGREPEIACEVSRRMVPGEKVKGRGEASLEFGGFEKEVPMGKGELS
jgi:hypothetical protein